jgi:hypothetical protein
MLFLQFPSVFLYLCAQCVQVTGFQRLSNMCEVDIDIFCDGERYGRPRLLHILSEITRNGLIFYRYFA